MTLKKPFLFIVLSLAGLSTAFAQGRPTSQEELIKTGVSFYSEGKYYEAASILQLASSSPEALYWLSLAELSSGNFDKSLTHLETLEKTDPNGRWSAEVPYHRGRCLYYLGRHEEALASLQGFAASLPDSDPRKASAWYWQGESLLALGRLDNAADSFSAVIENFPNSSKYEASYYRLNIINQKKIEAELLAILKWSHEESLKSMEEYQERERNYEQAIAAYQKRIGELLAASGEPGTVISVSPETSGNQQQRITDSETDFTEGSTAVPIFNGGDVTELRHLNDEERAIKLQELRAAALELSDILKRKLNEVE
ncbi:MAG: tetratricopeptide repeat protein [Treponema sp.]|nr:tetratricopeptide repeat protein [Treponema sp.]